MTAAQISSKYPLQRNVVNALLIDLNFKQEQIRAKPKRKKRKFNRGEVKLLS